jgi:hypothetical protein
LRLAALGYCLGDAGHGLDAAEICKWAHS